LLNQCDPAQSINGQMQAPLHHVEDLPELQEVLAFGSNQRIYFEERHDSLTKIIPPKDLIRKQVLLMVVMPSVAIDLPATEGCRQEFESPQALLALDNNESRLHLPSQSHTAVLLDGTTEAAFAVDEADDPLLDSWPFLLIARTRRIVTEHVFYHTVRYRGMLGCSST
jgi:hypothetical protein